MGKRLIIKGASFITNAIDRITPSTTYYSVIYNLSHCTASNSATSIAAGSTYTVTITANSGYNISSVTVKHNGQTVMPTGSGYSYTINNVSGNITVTATATAVVTNYTVTYDLENATASNNATTVTAGSSYTVTLTPLSGYEISSASVTHNGQTVNPTSGYTYNIPSVSGNILVECVAEEESSVEDIDLTDSILKSGTMRQFLHYKTNKNSFQYNTSLTSTKLCVVDVSAYVGYDIELYAFFGAKASDAYDSGPAYFHCFASSIKTDIPWTGTQTVNNAVTVVEYIPYDGGRYKTKTLTIPQGARYLVCTEQPTPISVVVKNVPKNNE